MKSGSFGLLTVLVLAGCNKQAANSPPAAPGAQPEKQVSFTEARRGFKTKLLRKEALGQPADEPPPELFRLVHYQSPAGKLAAYVSTPPKDGKKHPAIIWKFGGFSNSIGDTAWEEADADNDQSASSFRKAGVVMMYPALRGGNDNPGYCEGFLGEVDDVIAAADYLAKQDFVDPKRIYLGGHSTGGTLVLLAAAASDRFRAIFSLGPAHDVGGYGDENLPFDQSNPRELELRAPVKWLHSIKSPTFVFEGTQDGNLLSLSMLSRASSGTPVECFRVRGGTHFSIIQPLTRLLAAKVISDEGKSCNIAISDEEMSKLMGQ